MKPILEIRNIGKKYKIQHLAGGYLSLRERMTNALKFERTVVEDFWALKDISFDVMSGESIGVIGRNGAGKSTLLKILSKITPPTTGHIFSRGRIASLLEVGTGFHPELTGRENIFFNGSLLGMKRKEIEAKFDEIVDFSGVEKFLDTPLKHYSSGMQLRLAFAVAAFLDPEILIIDEVLAVGDAEFQKKCLRKMENVGKEGRTILFVSHNLNAVQNICSKSILIDNGRNELLSNTDLVIERYLSTSGRLINLETDFVSIKRKNGKFWFRKLTFSENPIPFGNSIEFRVVVESLQEEHVNNVEFGVALNDKNGVTVVHCSSDFISSHLPFNGKKETFEVSIENKLKPGSYSMTLFLRVNGVIEDWLVDALSLSILDGNPYGFNNSAKISGLVFPNFNMKKLQ